MISERKIWKCENHHVRLEQFGRQQFVAGSSTEQIHLLFATLIGLEQENLRWARKSIDRAPPPLPIGLHDAPARHQKYYRFSRTLLHMQQLTWHVTQVRRE